MSYIVLARKWRPKRFAEMVGQEHVLRALSNSLDSGKVHHAFLFTGTRGVGKTTVARILAKSLNCETGVSANPCGACAACREIDEGRFVDLIEVDAASRTKVDDTREILDNVQYSPTRGRYKVYLIDEVHMLSNHSFNALLKTLEEPPPHVKFLLATTDPQKLPVTVLSRCLQFSLKRLSASLIGERLKFIAAAENLEFEPAAVALIARAAEGSMRDGLSLMDQLIAFGGGALNEANTRSMLGTIDRGHVTRILDALARQDGPGLIAHVQELDRDAPDYDRALIELAAFLQRIAIVQIVPDAALEDEEFDAEALTRLAGALSPEDVQLYYQIALGGRRDLAMAPEPRIGFEMSLLRMLAFRPETAAAVGAGSSAAIPSRAIPSGAMPSRAMPSSAPSPVVAAPSPAPAEPVQSGGMRGPATIDAGNWATVVEAAGMSGMVRQFALNCAPASFDNESLRLQFDQSAAHRRTRQIEDKLAQCLSVYLGREIRIVYESSESALITPARRRAMAEQDKTLRAAAAFEEDAAVKGLRERFGADVDAASVKPTN
ncbi:MAG: DNA polymerase III subunit gamma/tau [Pseudomonadota bacterium]|nr:DNA polymerase III subunit gamma/tau [Pseudomonadota bacterium]